METRDLRTGIVMNGYPRDRFAAQIGSSGSSNSNSGGIINANSSNSVNGLSTAAAPGSGGGGDSPHGRTDWEADETLEAYIQNLQARRK
eukprot:12342-Heterococcus_DN1.PRE.3